MSESTSVSASYVRPTTPVNVYICAGDGQCCLPKTQRPVISCKMIAAEFSSRSNVLPPGVAQAARRACNSLNNINTMDSSRFPDSRMLSALYDQRSNRVNKPLIVMYLPIYRNSTVRIKCYCLLFIHKSDNAAHI